MPAKGQRRAVARACEARRQMGAVRAPLCSLGGRAHHKHDGSFCPSICPVWPHTHKGHMNIHVQAMGTHTWAMRTHRPDGHMHRPHQQNTHRTHTGHADTHAQETHTGHTDTCIHTYRPCNHPGNHPQAYIHRPHAQSLSFSLSHTHTQSSESMRVGNPGIVIKKEHL